MITMEIGLVDLLITVEIGVCQEIHSTGRQKGVDNRKENLWKTNEERCKTYL